MDTEWMQRGSCRFEPPGTFFPSDGVGGDAARRICATCKVQAACLEYALAGDLFGWWAGTSERARRRLRKGITNPDPLCVAPGDGTQGGH